MDRRSSSAAQGTAERLLRAPNATPRPTSGRPGDGGRRSERVAGGRLPGCRPGGSQEALLKEPHREGGDSCSAVVKRERETARRVQSMSMWKEVRLEGDFLMDVVSSIERFVEMYAFYIIVWRSFSFHTFRWSAPPESQSRPCRRARHRVTTPVRSTWTGKSARNRSWKSCPSCGERWERGSRCFSGRAARRSWPTVSLGDGRGLLRTKDEG